MNNHISKQYNIFGDDFDRQTLKYDQKSRASFYSFFDFETKEKKLLDIACGGGYDLKHYQDIMGCEVYGVDASEKQVEITNQRLDKDSAKVGHDYSIPFEDNSFDIVVSKYAPQGFEDIAKFYKEVVRILKPSGQFIILATHPMRHFLEKTEKPRDYFKKEVVTSWIYERTLPLKEYSHTFNDYFSPYFFQNFSLEKYIEEYGDHESIERIDNEKYPAYFIYRATKK